MRQAENLENTKCNKETEINQSGHLDRTQIINDDKLNSYHHPGCASSNHGDGIGSLPCVVPSKLLLGSDLGQE